MKKYDEDKKIENIVCNCCGREIAPADASEQAAFLVVRQEWGYFSKWDGCCHSFDICEDCYEKMMENWMYPPVIEERTELL